jgi:hypothetical protein
MSNVVVIGNGSAGALGFLQFSNIASGASKTKTMFTIDLDPFLGALDRVSNLGGYVTVDGTVRTGCQTVTVAATLAAATRTARVDTTSGPYTLTMMLLSAVPLNTIIHILFAVDGGDLTIDGNGAETINGVPNVVMTAVGTKHLKKTATGWVTV